MHDDDLGNTVTSVHSGIDVTLKSRDTEDCHRIGLTEKTTQKKTIIPLFNLGITKMLHSTGRN